MQVRDVSLYAMYKRHLVDHYKTLEDLYASGEFEHDGIINADETAVHTGALLTNEYVSASEGEQASQNADSKAR
jgi:hypothetical protein